MYSDKIQEAIDWANDPTHNGAGYHLRLAFPTLGELEVVVKADEARGYKLFRVAHNYPGDGERVLVNPDQLLYVTVRWV